MEITAVTIVVCIRHESANKAFALFGCECMSKDKTPGRACQHTLALLSYVREKIQHVPYKFVNNVKSSMSVLDAGGLRESYFKISHVSTKNEIFIPRDQNITWVG